MSDTTEELRKEYTIQAKDGYGNWRAYSFVDKNPQSLQVALRCYQKECPHTEFRIAVRRVTEWVDAKDEEVKGNE